MTFWKQNKYSKKSENNLILCVSRTHIIVTRIFISFWKQVQNVKSSNRKLIYLLC